MGVNLGPAAQILSLSLSFFFNYFNFSYFFLALLLKLQFLCLYSGMEWGREWGW